MFFPNGFPSNGFSKADINKMDNIDTYNFLSEIDVSNAVEDRLYFIRSENKYYRYDTLTHTMIVAIDLTSITTSLQQLQVTKADKIEMENRFTTANNKLENVEGNVNILAGNVDTLFIRTNTQSANITTLQTNIGSLQTNKQNALIVTNPLTLVNDNLSLNSTITNLPTTKQDKLTAGTNIAITGNVISATAPTYTAGTNVTIVSNAISSTTAPAVTSAIANLEAIWTAPMYNAPSATYGFTWRCVSNANTGANEISAIPWCNVFWTVKDMVYVNVNARINILDVNYQNSDELLAIKLPFKMLPSSENGGSVFGAPKITQHGNSAFAYGGVWEVKAIVGVSYPNTNGNTSYYNLLAPYRTSMGDGDFVTGRNAYGKTVQYQTLFSYKAKWPLEQVP